jgi:hypothetical protein
MMRDGAIKGALLVTLAGLVQALTPTADAASVTYSIIVGSNTSTATTKGFDASLGTLESVDITYTVKVGATTTVFDSTTNTGSVKTSATFDVSLVGSLPLPPSYQVSKSDTYDSNTLMFTNTLQGTPTVAYTKSTGQSTAIVDEFIYDGKLTLSVSAMNGTAESATAQASVLLGTAGFSSGQVTYNYSTTAIPEPSSLMLGSLGAFGGFVFSLRRRYRRPASA